ncbi:MAG: SCO family protein [Planctomycetota bacterium]
MNTPRRPARRLALASLIGMGLGCAAIVGSAGARDYSQPRDQNEPTPTVDDQTRLEEASRHLNAERTTPTPGLTDAAGRPIPQPPPAVAEPLPEAMQGVGLDEKLGDKLPLDLAFTDKHGNAVTLGDYFNDGKPVLLNPIYYKCPMLCGLISQGLTDGLRQVKFNPGDDFTVLSISFNPDETPELARANADATFARLARPQAQAGWHHLVGDAENIDRLLAATGFNIKLQPDGEYAHPAAVVLISPDGTITRYLANTSFDPNTLRRAIVEAGEGTVGSFLDVLVLTCLQFNHATGNYELAMGAMRIGAVLTVAALGVGIGGMLWLDRRRRPPHRPTPPTTPATA